jgi:hypothetical protein
MFDFEVVRSHGWSLKLQVVMKNAKIYRVEVLTVL